MRDTDQLLKKSGQRPPPLLSQRSFTQNLLALSPKLVSAPASFVNYDADEWLPTIRAAVSDLPQFVLKPWIILTVFTLVLNVYVDVFFKKPPWWVTMPPFAHTVVGGALTFLMVFRTNTAYSRWWEARLMWGQITIGSRNIAAQSGSMMHDQPRLELLSLVVAFPVALKNSLRDEPTLPSQIAGAESIAGDGARVVSPSLRALCAAPSAPVILVEAMSKVIRAGLRNEDGLASTSYLHLAEEMRSLMAAAVSASATSFVSRSL